MRTVTFIFCSIVLASCSHVTGSSPLPADLRNGESVQPLTGNGYKSLYGFNGPDGAQPFAGLTDVNGTLYGTASAGGSRAYGTVFKITTSGEENLLCSFKGGNDGAYPNAGLINVSGILYSTTHNGGSKGYGTVFKITTSGKETVVYPFKGGTDGGGPIASLVALNGTLYGTTPGPGAGTVFKVSTSGEERVLYRFKGGTDGEYPQAGLTDVNGALYGTTAFGGASNEGTVFKVTTSGKETVLYSFQKGGSDGVQPYAGLTYVNGTLYGTTIFGGGSRAFGTVFKITASGKESVLHSFKGDPDGANPVASLTAVKGVLYGTTGAGGAGGASGAGTVFKITTSGKESVLYSFKGDLDGASPVASLTAVKGVLYGTTSAGGAYNEGTVFAISR